MADLPHLWATYARLQNNLRREYQVGDRSSGIEAGMDHILDSVAGALPADAEVNKVIATGRRRERHRIARRDPLLNDYATAHPDGTLTARSELAAIHREVGDRNWDLLAAIGVGSSYKDISVAMSLPPGLIRVKVARLRAALARAA
jgi:hypothetical protein